MSLAKKLAIVFGVILCIPIGLNLYVEWSLLPTTLRSFELKDGVRLDIISRPNVDTAPGLLFEVRRGRKVIRGRRWMGVIRLPKRVQFEAITLREGGLLAVYERTKPFDLFLIYDADTGEAWPYSDGLGDYEWQRAVVVGDRLIQRVRGLTGEQRYQRTEFTDQHLLTDND